MQRPSTMYRGWCVVAASGERDESAVVIVASAGGGVPLRLIPIRGEPQRGESVRDDQFPAQRVTGVWLEASPFSVRLREEIRVEVGPQFVTGERGPAFFDSFTTSGAPSGFLRQIAGGYDGVRLSACPAVKVTAQNQVSGLVGGGRSCSIEVEVGKLLVAEDSVRVTGAGS